VWLTALRLATGRVDLSSLTTRAWDRLFPSRHFQSATLAWCPLCLSDDPIPYHRLAWSLQQARCCPKHKVLLQTRCAKCDKKVPVIHDRSRVTICPWCARDLRAALPGGALASDSFDCWCAEQIGAIIMRSQSWNDEINWDPRRAFQLLCSSRGLDTAASFARYLGASKLTAWYWLTGRARPTLASTLWVYHRFGVDLAAHIFSRAPGFLPAHAGASQYEARLPQPRHPRQIDWNDVRDRLIAESKRPIQQAPSFIGVAAQLGIARRTLRAHEPMLCRRLATRWRQRRKREIQERDDVLKWTIRAALPRIAVAGETPSQKRIETVIGRPGLFNRRYARRVLLELLA